jgi:hypothetical protein
MLLSRSAGWGICAPHDIRAAGICGPHTRPSALRDPLRVGGLGCLRTRAMNPGPLPPAVRPVRCERVISPLPRFLFATKTVYYEFCRGLVVDEEKV